MNERLLTMFDSETLGYIIFSVAMFFYTQHDSKDKLLNVDLSSIVEILFFVTFESS